MKKERTKKIRRHGIMYSSIFRPFNVFLKKHYCPKCNEELSVIFKKEVVNTKSPDAYKYDFSIADGGPLIGNIEVRTAVFNCDQCDSNFELKEIREIEKEKRNK